MTFIKKIFQHKIDEETHKQFTRFSKGTFEHRAMSSISRGKETFKVRISYDLVKDTAHLIAKEGGTFHVSGITVKGKIKTPITKTLQSQELQQLCNNYDFVLLDITGQIANLKCKKSVPKPGKELDTTFATATLPSYLLSEFAFDCPPTLKKVAISHTFIITDIVIPPACHNDAALARIHAKRKGKIIRILEIDGTREEKTQEFIA